MSVINDGPINGPPVNGGYAAADIVFAAITGTIPAPLVLLEKAQFRIDDCVPCERRRGVVAPECRTDIVRRGW